MNAKHIRKLIDETDRAIDALEKKILRLQNERRRLKEKRDWFVMKLIPGDDDGS